MALGQTKMHSSQPQPQPHSKMRNAINCIAMDVPLGKIEDTSIEPAVVISSRFGDATRRNVPKTSEAPKNRTLHDSHHTDNNSHVMSEVAFRATDVALL